MSFGFHQDQLRRQANAITLVQRGSFDDPIHSEVPGDLVQLPAACFQMKHGLTRDHPQAWDAGEFRDERIGHTVCEIFLGRIAIQIRKRQHGQSGLREQPLALDWRYEAIAQAGSVST